MVDTLAGGVSIVVAAKRGKVEYWAAATAREAAVAAVEQFLAPRWKATLTSRHLTPEQVAELKLRPNGVRKLKYVP